MPGYREIPLGGKRGEGRVAKVSPKDYKTLSSYSWNVCPNGYVRRTDRSTGKDRTVFMHNHVLFLAREIDSMFGRHDFDHINRNPLDNRRGNLRKATVTQQQANREVHRGNASGYKGARKSSVGKGFVAACRVENKKHSVDGFETLEDAARAYDSMALFYFGKFAKTNFPNPEPKDVFTVRRELRASKNMASPYIGVTPYGRHGRWIAQIWTKQENKSIGTYDTDEEAARARDAYARENGIPVNDWNFPEEVG